MSDKKQGDISGNANLMTLNDFVTEVGAARSSVMKSIQQGRISAHKKGRHWFVEKSMVKVWKEGRQTPHGKTPQKAKTNGQRVISTYEAENRKKVAQAELAEMDLAEKKGDLIPRAEVISFSFKAARKCRDAILGVPNRLANEIAAEEDPHQVQILMENALSEALEELSGMVKKWDSPQ